MILKAQYSFQGVSASGDYKILEPVEAERANTRKFQGLRKAVIEISDVLI
jgi:hypothetical protein